jgi:putative redox protein
MITHAQANWTDGLQFIARANNGPAVILDNPEGGSGATPMELFLISIAGCTGMDVVSIMKKKRANMTHFQVNISGDRAADHPMRYTHIRIEYVVHGKGIKPQDMERSIELSVSKYCGAIASVNTTVEHSYRIIDTEK